MIRRRFAGDTAALAWYRARGERQPLGPIAVPTVYIWGDADDTVGRAAAEGTGEFIAAPYRFEALSGVGHYAADQVPERVTTLLLEHLARHPIGRRTLFGSAARLGGEIGEAVGDHVAPCRPPSMPALPSKCSP
jgi:hypothetical protein